MVEIIGRDPQRRRFAQLDAEARGGGPLLVPAVPRTSTPVVSDASFESTLITPLTALGPNSVPPGPLTTSIWAMSSIIGVCSSQNTPECSVE